MEKPSVIDGARRRGQELGGKAKVATDAREPRKKVFVRSREVSEILDISESTVERMCRNREIAAIRVSGQWRIHLRKLMIQFGIEEGDLEWQPMQDTGPHM